MAIGKGFGKVSGYRKRSMPGVLGHLLPWVSCGGHVAFITVVGRYERAVGRQKRRGMTSLDVRTG